MFETKRLSKILTMHIHSIPLKSLRICLIDFGIITRSKNSWIGVLIQFTSPTNKSPDVNLNKHSHFNKIFLVIHLPTLKI